jgi:hypothetical protein
MDGTGEFCEARCLVHGIASGEGDVGKGIGYDDLHELRRGHLATTVEGPRLGVMAAWTLMTATRTIDGGPEARTIHHRIFKYV